MANCVIRRLKESINDDNLYALDELVIDVDTTSYTGSYAPYIGIDPIFGATITVKAINGVVFCSSKDYQGSGNLYYEKDIIKSYNGVYGFVYFKGKGQIIIKNKYLLERFYISYDGSDNTYYFAQVKLKDFCNMNHLTSIYTSCTQLIGNITDINYIPNLQEFKVLYKGGTNYMASFTGNISDINLPNLSTLILTSCRSLTLYNNNKFANLASLSELYLNYCMYNANNSDTVDASIFPTTTRFISNANGTNYELFTWPSENARSVDKYIIAFDGCRFKEDGSIDRMLINQAKLNLNPSLAAEGLTITSNHWLFKISIWGQDRTSASDVAVETLRSKGVEVWINNTKL